MIKAEVLLGIALGMCGAILIYHHHVDHGRREADAAIYSIGSAALIRASELQAVLHAIEQDLDPIQSGTHRYIINARAGDFLSLISAVSSQEMEAVCKLVSEPKISDVLAKTVAAVSDSDPWSVYGIQALLGACSER